MRSNASEWDVKQLILIFILLQYMMVIIMASWLNSECTSYHVRIMCDIIVWYIREKPQQSIDMYLLLWTNKNLNSFVCIKNVMNLIFTWISILVQSNQDWKWVTLADPLDLLTNKAFWMWPIYVTGPVKIGHICTQILA